MVLGAGFLPNFLYSLYLCFRNHTLPTFFQKGWLREALLAVTIAVVWLSGLFLYGWGATLVGVYGTSVGYTLFTAMSVVSATAVGMLTGEWQATSRHSRRLLAAGVGTILLSVVVLNLGGLFPG